MALCTEFSSHEIRAKTIVYALHNLVPRSHSVLPWPWEIWVRDYALIQLRDILDASKENSESDSWIQELHRKSRKKKVFENALDTKNRTMILRNL